MGDRISIQFQNGKDKSIFLFSHWQGMGLKETAQEYVNELKKEAKKEGDSLPLYRLDPDTVLVDFIRHITHGEARITSDLYLCADVNDGDNSDNGHHIINLGSK